MAFWYVWNETTIFDSVDLRGSADLDLEEHQHQSLKSPETEKIKRASKREIGTKQRTTTSNRSNPRIYPYIVTYLLIVEPDKVVLLWKTHSPPPSSLLYIHFTYLLLYLPFVSALTTPRGRMCDCRVTTTQFNRSYACVCVSFCRSDTMTRTRTKGRSPTRHSNRESPYLFECRANFLRSWPPPRWKISIVFTLTNW